MNRLLPLALTAVLGLSACDGGGNSSVTLPQPARDIADFVRSLIAGQTCETTQPTAINGVDLLSAETTVDVAGVTPSCSG